MHDTHVLEHALIVGLYLIIAMQFGMAFTLAKVDKKGREALLSLIMIFILCSVCGYASQIFSFSEKVERFLLWFLIFICLWYIFTNQSRIVVASLKDD